MQIGNTKLAVVLTKFCVVRTRQMQEDRSFERTLATGTRLGWKTALI
jgi:hypothetical protein